MEMEKLGIPTVTVVSSKFADLAKISLKGLGVIGLPIVIVEHPFELIPKENIEAKADAAFSDILKAATQWKPVGAQPVQQKPYPANLVKFTGTIEDINGFFFDKGWSMGIPVIPPSKRGVEMMLKGTSRRPDEVICTAPPRGGAITVEMVAVHAVMAGAKPEYMPVILAIIDAMKEDDYSWRSYPTTSPNYTLAIVNGPIAKEIGIGSGTGVGGGGYRANVSIGLTISSMVWCVGGCKIPTPDMGIVGSASEIIPPVMAENEDGMPEGWLPLHVEMGYKKMDNVVSVKACGGFDMLGENGQKAEDMLWSFAKKLGYAKSCFSTWENILIIPPQVAALLAKEGWTKDRIKEYLWENARSPISWWRRPLPKPALTIAKEAEGFAERYGPITPDTLVPVVDKPEKFKIVVIGGPGTHSFYYKGQQGRMVTKLITK